MSFLTRIFRIVLGRRNATVGDSVVSGSMAPDLAMDDSHRQRLLLRFFIFWWFFTRFIRSVFPTSWRAALSFEARFTKKLQRIWL